MYASDIALVRLYCGRNTIGANVILSRAHNGSGEAGTAVFSQESDGVHVIMSLAGAPNGVDQPAHIHIGTCTKNVATQWVLHNLMNGKSVSTLRGITLAELTSGKYVVNVHKSTNNIASYVACGKI